MSNHPFSTKAVIDWMHRTFGVDNQPQPDEVQTTCPECSGDKLYFNVKKGVGICHKASCGWRPTLFDLIAIVGFGPAEYGEWEAEKVEDRVEVELPGQPVLQVMINKLMTTHQPSVDYLRSRGIDDQVILNWGLTSDHERVYVPIMDNNLLVNFNSRVLPGVPGPKYLYCAGAKTSHYILGWEECRLWDDISLVENTFVSLAYRSRMRCSTTFGSNVSDVQASRITESSIRKVALLWDENAESSADRAAKKLHALGLRCAYWSILGQPDDYPMDFVFRGRARLMQAMDDGILNVDMRSECADARVRSEQR